MRFEILCKFWSFSDDNATKAEMEECETATTNPNQQNCSKPIVASSNNKEYNDEQKKPNFICGVIEGFYGRPWTTEQRKDLFRKWVKVMRLDFRVTLSMTKKCFKILVGKILWKLKMMCTFYWMASCTSLIQSYKAPKLFNSFFIILN